MTTSSNRWLWCLSTCVAVLLPVSAGCALAQQTTEPQMSDDTWTLTFSDEFDGDEVDTTKWEVLTRKQSHNNEKEYYLPEQATVSDGILRITATDEPHDGQAYRSARLESWFTQAYGKFEVRAKVPTTKGHWPAIWLLPRTARWPHGGEIDIMEHGGSKPAQVSSAYHFANEDREHKYVHQAYTKTDDDGAEVLWPNDFHVYSVIWTPEEIIFFVDHEEHYRVTQDMAPVSSTPMCVILNAAVGGWFDGDPDETTVFPQHLDVDYVRVYQRTDALEADTSAEAAEVPTE